MDQYIIELQESKRYNILKVWMCFFVLIIHAYSPDITSGNEGLAAILYRGTFVLSGIICDCAVPVFALLSGILLYAKPFTWRKNVAKKIKTILVPYLIFNSLYLTMLLGKWCLKGESIPYHSLTDWLTLYVGGGVDYKPILTVLWYLRDLFILNLAAPLIGKLVKKVPLIMLALDLTLWISALPIRFIQPYSLVFFVLGCLLVHYRVHFSDIDRIFPWWVVNSSLAILLLADVMTNRDFLPLHRLFVIVAIVFWIKISKDIDADNCFYKATLPATFFLYLTHRFVYTVTLFFVPDTIESYFVSYIMMPPTTLLGMMAVFYGMRRWTPHVLQILTGNRSVVIRLEKNTQMRNEEN